MHERTDLAGVCTIHLTARNVFVDFVTDICQCFFTLVTVLTFTGQVHLFARADLGFLLFSEKDRTPID